jgi:hypothetical protein
MDEIGVGQALVELTEAIDARHPGVCAHGLLGGEFGYGAEFANAVFAMHPYCWCERESCAWCLGCSCPEAAYHYFLDGSEVDGDAYYAAEAGAVGEVVVDEALLCGYCSGEVEPAANFEFKATGMTVRWYKYIGRSMEISGEAPTDWYEQCRASLGELLEGRVVDEGVGGRRDDLVVPFGGQEGVEDTRG